MDLLPSILGARTYAQATERVQEATGLDHTGAWREVRATVEASAWAILVAPELYIALMRWWAIQRLSDDLGHLREVRDRVGLALEEPSILEVIELSKEDQPTRIADGAIVRMIKVGPDVLSVRTKAYADAQNAVTKLEAELARGEERFHRASQAYRRKLEDVAEMSPRDQGRALLTMHLEERDLAGARALIETLGTARRALEASGDDVCANVDRRLKAAKEGEGK